MVIQPKNGLANRLQVIFSRLQSDRHLEVVWKPDDACRGHFLDHFEPVKNVSFVTRPTGKVRYRGCYADGKPDYRLLMPRPEIMEEVRANLHHLQGNFTAIHVRRTDYVRRAKKRKRFTTDEEFFQFVDQSIGGLFVSCDTPETLTTFTARYPGRVKAFRSFAHPDQLRKSTLRHAVIDIFTCCYAQSFMGSDYSTFSRLIRHLRQQHNH